jgi:hypothetical protein
MELDQLKEMWSNVGSKQQGPSADALQALLHKKSKSPIAKMKRNLLMELLFIMVLYVGCVVYYFLHFTGGMLSLAWMLIVIGVLYIFYYLQKKKLLNQMECVSCEVKLNLKMQLQTLEKYVRFYLISGTIMFPVVFIATGMVGFFYAPDIAREAALKSKDFLWIFTTALVVFAFVLTAPIYFLNKWYVRKLYGRHIQQLKNILQEMEETELK